MASAAWETNAKLALPPAHWTADYQRILNRQAIDLWGIRPLDGELHATLKAGAGFALHNGNACYRSLEKLLSWLVLGKIAEGYDLRPATGGQPLVFKLALDTTQTDLYDGRCDAQPHSLRAVCRKRAPPGLRPHG